MRLNECDQTDAHETCNSRQQGRAGHASWQKLGGRQQGSSAAPWALLACADERLTDAASY